ncbi:DNA primase [Actinomyces sp. oral taxon 181]|uniref:DNA primase n=1 Tax=Actinomyces sp. oral taxon 181 TaxID=712121 RepID=UPI0002A26CDC|nr:DNA primase [Actinomyces sp. oral taxon 181]EKY15037.1 DNA primase [Actinomyces sp. oral taxon 181 str. F0379]
MAGLILKEDIAAVRDASRIEEIVGERVALRPAGVDSLKGLCPFHDERTPSFHVRPSQGFWHCFGCGEGGDVISFVQKVDSLSFTEAVEALALKAGITLRYEAAGSGTLRREEPGRRQRLLDAHRVAEEFYQARLASPEAHLGRQFLGRRGFDEAMCRPFGIGYSPTSWDALTRQLRSKGFTDQEIETAGLAIRGNRGLYDRFRGRLMWPIRDITGATVGFGARRLNDEDKESPKYLNTPETPIYHKSQVLYGLDLAKKEITQGRRVVIVEGYTDVMAAHAAGVRCAVATCGTAFGEEHVKIVRRLLGDTADSAAGVVLSNGKTHGGEVIFTFDGDAAGQKAALRAFDMDQNFAAQTFVAVEPHGMDPCELRMAQGERAVVELVNSRTPLFEFVIRSVLRQLDLRTAEGRVKALRAAAPVVARIRDRALQREYTRSLAGWIGMDISEVARAVRSSGNSRPAPNGRGATPEASAPMPARRGPEDPVSKIERQALEALVQYPMYVVGSGFEELGGEAFSVPSYRAVHDAIRAAGGLDAFLKLFRQAEEHFGKGEKKAVQAATRAFVDDVRELMIPEVAAVLMELAVAPLPQDREDQLRAYCRGAMGAMVRLDVTRRLADANANLQRLSEDDPQYTQAFRELMRLEEVRRRFTERAQ